MGRFWVRTVLAAAACLVAVPSLGGMPPDRALPDVDLWGHTYSDNHFSAMCVDCHGPNPSFRIPDVSFPFAEAEANYRGSHFVRHVDGSDLLTADLTPEKLDAWGGSGALSEYGNIVTYLSGTGVAGELICESCHNIVQNLGPGLLLDAYDSGTGVATLCEGCHSDITGSSHHPLGAVDNSDREGVRNPPTDVTETDGVQYFASPNVVTCISCHKVHEAQTASGARILRRGSSRVTTIPAVTQGPVNVVYYADLPVPGAVPGEQVQRSTSGLHRQSDMISPDQLVTNEDPLCDACHKAND